MANQQKNKKKHICSMRPKELYMKYEKYGILSLSYKTMVIIKAQSFPSNLEFMFNSLIEGILSFCLLSDYLQFGMMTRF